MALWTIEEVGFIPDHNTVASQRQLALADTLEHVVEGVRNRRILRVALLIIVFDQSFSTLLLFQGQFSRVSREALATLASLAAR